MNPTLETFRYDDEIVRKFLVATFVWGLVGMLVDDAEPRTRAQAARERSGGDSGDAM